MDREVRLIVPTVDEELSFFSNAREWFNEQGVKVLGSSEFTVSTCRDKAEFYKFCRRHDFKTPYTMQDELIIKPRFGKGSKDILKIDRSQIVQQYVDMPEYSIDYFRDGDTESIIPRLRLDIVNGESTRAALNFSSRLVGEAKRLADELGLQGHNVMQCFYDGNRVLWGEVNCRYGGGSWLSFPSFNSPAFLTRKYGN